MAQLRSLSQGKLEAYKIDPRSVKIKPGFNYRDTSSEDAKRHIAWLKESIRERGVDEAIWIENDGENLWLIDGECRLRALCELWDEGLEVFVPTFSYKGDEAAVLAKSLIANGGLPPTLLEFGRAAERLQAYGWSVERIASLTPPHLGLRGPQAERYVRDAVELQKAPLAVKKAVSEGIDGVKVSEPLALAAAKQGPIRAPQIIAEAVAEAKAEGKTVAKRPKGEGPVAKAKKAEAVRSQTLEEVGDEIVDSILNEAPDWDKLEKLAAKWNKMRGR